MRGGGGGGSLGSYSESVYAILLVTLVMSQ